jgi:hypothetical protein
VKCSGELFYWESEQFRFRIKNGIILDPAGKRDRTSRRNAKHFERQGEAVLSRLPLNQN